jgi:hypothetical protein
MPRKTDDTTVNEALQATPSVADDWATEVVTRLPGNVQHQASVLKAFERSRQIRSATDLLRGLLAYVYTVHSFQHLSIWSVLVGLADVSANDWRKRLQHASAWQSPALARGASGFHSGFPLAGAGRMAPHFVDRWHPGEVPRSPRDGLAGAYRL